MKLKISPHGPGSRGISFVPDLTPSHVDGPEVMSDSEKEAWRGLTAEIITSVLAYVSQGKYADDGDRKNGEAFVGMVMRIASQHEGKAVTLDMVTKEGYPILMNSILDSVSEKMLEVATLDALLTKKLGPAENQGVRGTVTISYSDTAGESILRKKVRLIGSIPTFVVTKLRELYSQLLPATLAPVVSLGTLGANAGKGTKEQSFNVLGSRTVADLSDTELMALWTYMNDLMAKLTMVVAKRLLNRPQVGQA